MASPTGIIPEVLMYPGQLGAVMDFLIALPAYGDEKEKLLFGWAKTVGVRLSGSQYRKVRLSGKEYQGG
jgi:hypothetical protein